MTLLQPILRVRTPESEGLAAVKNVCFNLQYLYVLHRAHYIRK